MKKLTKQERLSCGKQKCLFKNVRYNKSTGFYIGQKRHKGSRIFAQASTPLEAARLLNKRCLDVGAEAPNPSINKITWKSIQFELDQKYAKEEIIAINETYLAKWKERLPAKNLKKMFNILNHHILKHLK